jgi:hypothetical protein
MLYNCPGHGKTSPLILKQNEEKVWSAPPPPPPTQLDWVKILNRLKKPPCSRVIKGPAVWPPRLFRRVARCRLGPAPDESCCKRSVTVPIIFFFFSSVPVLSNKRQKGIPFEPRLPSALLRRLQDESGVFCPEHIYCTYTSLLHYEKPFLDLHQFLWAIPLGHWTKSKLADSQWLSIASDLS